MSFHPLISFVDARSGRIESAEGDYVAFVEGDGSEPGLEAIARQLQEIRPDVLLLAPPGAGPRSAFTIEDWPAALDAAPGLRDKIFRRDFLSELGMGVAPGDFGELPLTYSALLAAARIAVSERSRPPASRHVPGDPFGAFGAYDRVFEAAEGLGSTFERRRRLLPVSMLLHYLSLIGKVPDERRTEFFALMSSTYARRARGDEKVSAERRSAFYARCTALPRQRRGRVRARASQALRRTKRAVLAGYYAFQLRRPVDPDLAVFAAYWYSSFACNPRAIYERLQQFLPRVRCIWVVDREHADAVPRNVPHVVAGTREYLRAIARAKWFVNNVGFPDEVVKREGTIRIHTHHGTPVKTMGLDLRDAFYAGERTDFDRQRRRWARWDYSVTQNRFSTVQWKRAYPAAYETLEVGYPRNDVLANAGDEDVREAREELGIESNRCVVLYAPTHREYVRGFLSPLDVDRLAERLGDRYLVLARMHYLQPASGTDGRRAKVRDVSAHPRIEDLFLAADVLVTDYSSILFDYAVLDRPLVVHAPDWEIYKTLRGTYLDLLEEPPGVVTRTEDELVDAFRSGRIWGGEASALRAAFRERYCALEDGGAAERVVRGVWLRDRDESPEAATRDRGRERIGA